MSELKKYKITDIKNSSIKSVVWYKDDSAPDSMTLEEFMDRFLLKGGKKYSERTFEDLANAFPKRSDEDPRSCPNCKREDENPNLFPWCKDCWLKKLRDDFPKWTSGNVDIDILIRKSQVIATTYTTYLEWIEPNQFTDCQYIAEGGFSKVYKAKWIDGPREKLTLTMYRPIREPQTTVVLKSFNNSKRIAKDFVNEIMTALDTYNTIGNIVSTQLHGITICPSTGDYALVMDYFPDGDLRKYIKQNLRWLQRLRFLSDIALYLKIIHKLGIVHGDLHGGNVLMKNEPEVKGSEFVNELHAFITDFGLSRPVDLQHPQDKGNYGIIPYMAPEILQGQKKSLASDVYAFGIIMWEFSASELAFYEWDHLSLIHNICEGVRPNILEGTPPLYSAFMQRCWDADPSKRPSSEEIHKTLCDWYNSCRDSENTANEELRLSKLDLGDQCNVIVKQFENSDEYIQMHPPLQRAKKNPKAVYHSQFVQKSTHFSDSVAVEQMLLENLEQLDIN